MLKNGSSDKPRYWYHISSATLRSKARLKAFKNEDAATREETEPNVPRICVSPSLDKCILAVPVGGLNTYKIFRTSSKVVARKPFRVKKRDILPFDAEITEEHWLLEDTDFVKVGEFVSLGRCGCTEYGGKDTSEISKTAIAENLTSIRCMIASGHIKVKLLKKYAHQRAGMSEDLVKKA